MPGQAIPEAAHAGNELLTVGDRPERKTRREHQDVSDAPDNPAGAERSALVQPKIEQITRMVVGSQGRYFVELEFKTTYFPYGGCDDSGRATHVLMEYATVDHVTREAEAASTVAVLEFGQISEVVCGWQPDLHNRPHLEEAPRPEKEVASCISRLAVDGRVLDRRIREYHWLVYFPAAAGGEPTSQEADLLPFRRRQTLEKGEQVLKRVGVRNAVGVEDPGPVEFLLQGLGKADFNSPTGAQIGRVANDQDAVRECRV